MYWYMELVLATNEEKRLQGSQNTRVRATRFKTEIQTLCSPKDRVLVRTSV